MNEEIRGTDTMQIIEDRGNVALYKFNNNILYHLRELI